MAMSVGVGLGIMFYYGLWWTVEKVTTSKTPARWLIGSVIVRMGITLFGFYFVITFDFTGQLIRLLLCLIGFFCTRFIITKLIHVKSTVPLETEVGRAP